MNRLLRAELFKQRTTRTTRTLLASMVALVVLVVGLHVFTLPADTLARAADQPKVFGWGTSIGALFAALLGAMGITAEFRHGTIRPTLLATPDRLRVVAAKAAAAALTGFAIGLLAEGLCAAVAVGGFAVRDIPVALGAGDYVQLLLGGAIASALWAVVGTGVGSLVRGQVGAVAGLCVWLLLVENILIGNVPAVARFGPAASAGALSGMIPNAGATTLLAPALGALLLVGYALVAGLIGMNAFNRSDIG